MGRIRGKALADKYKDFMYPVIAVAAAGREIPENEFWHLESAEVNASVRKEPDMAVLVYRADKLPEDSRSTLESYFNAGQKMEISAGYDKVKSRIFLGYLHQVEVCDLMEGYVEYTLICLDVKGLMKKSNVFQISGAKKAQQVLEDILGDRGYEFLVQDKEVSRLPDKLNVNCVIKGNTHYDWLCSLAEYLNYEFYCGRGVMTFKQAGEGSGDTVELTNEYGLMAVQAIVSMTGLTGSLSVYGYNRQDEAIRGNAEWTGGGQAFTHKMGQTLRGLSMKIWDPELETSEQAAAAALAAMERAKAQCCRLEALCLGIPELQPGIHVEITNENVSSLSGTIYVEEVCHRLDWQGYRSVVRGKV